VRVCVCARVNPSRPLLGFESMITDCCTTFTIGVGIGSRLLLTTSALSW
jgi:hypothetical protein